MGAACHSLEILRSEHASIRVVVETLRRSARGRLRGRTDDAVRPAAVLAYLDTFCTRIHAPKEDGPFCRRMLRRAPVAWPVVAASRRDQAWLKQSISALETRLLTARDGAGDDIADFTALCLHLLARQEAVLFPLAVQVLDPEDWRELDDIFATSLDPLAGIDRSAGLQTLLARIDAALPRIHPATAPDA